MDRMEGTLNPEYGQPSRRPPRALYRARKNVIHLPYIASALVKEKITSTAWPCSGSRWQTIYAVTWVVVYTVYTWKSTLKAPVVFLDSYHTFYTTRFIPSLTQVSDLRR